MTDGKAEKLAITQKFFIERFEYGMTEQDIETLTYECIKLAEHFLKAFAEYESSQIKFEDKQ